MVGEDQVGAAAQGAEARRAVLRALHLHVDGLGASLHRRFEDADLLLDAAVEAPLVLVAAAGGEDAAIRLLRQERANRVDPALRLRQIVEAELQEPLAADFL